MLSPGDAPLPLHDQIMTVLKRRPVSTLETLLRRLDLSSFLRPHAHVAPRLCISPLGKALTVRRSTAAAGTQAATVSSLQTVKPETLAESKVGPVAISMLSACATGDDW